MPELDFTSGFYQSISPQNSGQNCINWFVNVAEQKTYSQENCLPCPGVALHDAGQELEVNRGGHEMAGAAYFICGQRLYRINRSVVAGVEFFDRENLGEILGTSRVIMDDSGVQLAIVVPGESYYIYDSGENSLTLVTNSDFDGPFDSVVFVDGSFYLNKTNTGKIIQTDLNEGRTCDPLAFGTAEADPDKIVRLFKFNNELWAAGTETMTPYRNVGGNGFVMQAIQGGVLPYGLRSRYALVKFKRNFVFLASGESAEPSIMLCSGGEPEPISTEPVDQTIQNKTDFEIDNAFFLRYSQNGEDFVFATLGDTTFGFCYRASRLSGRKIWFERKSRIGERDRAWRVNSIVQAYNRIFVADAVDGRIGILSDTEGSEYGNAIIREITTRPFSNEGRPIFCKSIEAVIDGMGGDNYVSLEYSDNNYTFTQPIYLRIGDAGEYDLRKIWRRLGRFHQSRLFRIRTSSTIPPTINKLVGDFA
jgi:Phage stabilisation protein